MAEIGEGSERLLPQQVSTEEYQHRLDVQDRQNLQLISRNLREVLDSKKIRGNLVAVGGSINKPLPRKDIDLLVLLESPSQAPKPFNTELDKSLFEFTEFFEPLIDTLATAEGGFKKLEVITPAMEEEFQSPNILKHDGSIKMQKGNSTPLEFIRYPRHETIEQFAKAQKSAWVLLEAS